MPLTFRIIFILIFFLLYCDTTIAQTETGVTSRIAKTYAIVIGISGYQEPGVPRLNYADKDANMFADYLKSKAGGSIPEGRIKLLLNEDATIAAVYEAMQWLKTATAENDLVYFYFSGHGDIETRDTISLGYLLVYNSPPNNYRNNAIAIEDLNNLANSITLNNKAKIILITDACHSGKLAGDFFKGKQFVAQQLSLVLNHEIRLASCGVKEEAAEGISWGNGRGVFSYYLLLGLQGMADKIPDGVVKFSELDQYLDSSFAADKELIRQDHKQKPVLDGNPDFKMALIDKNTLLSLHKNPTTDSIPQSQTQEIFFSNVKPAGRQPIDFFFAELRRGELDSAIPFNSYLNIPTQEVPLKLIDDYVLYREEEQKKHKQIVQSEQPDALADNLSTDTSVILQQQLRQVKSLHKRFIEKYIQTIHDRAQDMINAYLAGDTAEFERRQYYYSGKASYTAFLEEMKLAQHLIPEDHYLARVFHIQYSYLAGMVNRLAMAKTQDTDSLLQSAFRHQQAALANDPYAAYTHNEIGNLYMYNKKFDSAFVHFDIATRLSPTWAFPWCNLVRLNLALNHIPGAKRAIIIADSLQPGLASLYTNAGLVMEKDKNYLAAESYYLRSIRKNDKHFLPYERLGYLYLQAGDYETANRYLYAVRRNTEGYSLNFKSTEYGIEHMPGLPGKMNPPPLLNDLSFQIMKAYKEAVGYEKENKWREALAIYEHISEMENRQQDAQASYKSIPDSIEFASNAFQDIVYDISPVSGWQIPLPIAGTLKASMIYEQLGEYQAAEKLLLDQVDRNRTAGYLRQYARDSIRKLTRPDSELFDNHNCYWLDINECYENATYNFYTRMRERFPRDADWHQNAGMFLYRRLELTYRQKLLHDLEAFDRHQSVYGFGYPYNRAITAFEHDFTLHLPGTDDSVVVHYGSSNPIGTAFVLLRQSLKLSGHVAIDISVLKAMADLKSWMGDTDEALAGYKELVGRAPDKDSFRVILAGYLAFLNHYPEALDQLKILDARKGLHERQLYDMASWQLMNRQFRDALTTLNRMDIKTEDQRDDIMTLYARLFMADNKPEIALRYLQDSLSSIPKAQWEYRPGDDYFVSRNIFRLYAIARMYSAMGKKKKALRHLKIALEAGFWYKDVLNKDPVWAELCRTKKWNKLLQQYDLEKEYSVYTKDTNYDKFEDMDYLIPKAK